MALLGTPHLFWQFEPWLVPAVDAILDVLVRVFGGCLASAAYQLEKSHGTGSQQVTSSSMKHRTFGDM